MAAKPSGLSRDMIIHPGETLRELIIDRGMKQSELAKRTGYSQKHISRVLNGADAITWRFAEALENVFGVSAKFWLNLQANFDLELAAFNRIYTVTDNELLMLREMGDEVEYLHENNILDKHQTNEELVLSLRKLYSVNNITVIPSLETNNVPNLQPPRQLAKKQDTEAVPLS